MGLVNTNTTPILLKTVKSGKIKPEELITHRFKLDEIIHAYEVFGNAAKEKAMNLTSCQAVFGRCSCAQLIQIRTLRRSFLIKIAPKE